MKLLLNSHFFFAQRRWSWDRCSGPCHRTH